jgi:hypothetical protein
VELEAMEDSWTSTDDGGTIKITGQHILKALETDKTIYRNAVGEVVKLGGCHKDGWAKMDLPRKRKPQKLWKGLLLLLLLFLLWYRIFLYLWTSVFKNCLSPPPCDSPSSPTITLVELTRTKKKPKLPLSTHGEWWLWPVTQ